MTPRVRLYACIAAANHGTTIPRVMSQSRYKRDVQARWELWRRLHEDGFSFSRIGRWTGRHHTTVMHGLGLIGTRRTTVSTSGECHCESPDRHIIRNRIIAAIVGDCSATAAAAACSAGRLSYPQPRVNESGDA